MRECLKIFIVEDDDNIREIFSLALKFEGYDVESFANGQEAIDRLRKTIEPCLVLLDMMMPVLNGEGFMEQFHKLPATIIPIPVFLISATSTKQESQKMGCRGFIKKPVDLDALLSIVRQFCKTIQTAA